MLGTKSDFRVTFFPTEYTVLLFVFVVVYLSVCLRSYSKKNRPGHQLRSRPKVRRVYQFSQMN